MRTWYHPSHKKKNMTGKWPKDLKAHAKSCWQADLDHVCRQNPTVTELGLQYHCLRLTAPRSATCDGAANTQVRTPHRRTLCLPPSFRSLQGTVRRSFTPPVSSLSAGFVPVAARPPNACPEGCPAERPVRWFHEMKLDIQVVRLQPLKKGTWKGPWAMWVMPDSFRARAVRLALAWPNK
jgi:hypothetical protein